MNQSDQVTSSKSILGTYITWGIVIGSIVGFFTGIFWFEMGLSLLFGTAAGLIFGTIIGSIIDKKTQSVGS